ncbi:MAG: hypothetical protein ACKOE6_04260 [Flammeovirgaceae bacterium]
MMSRLILLTGLSLTTVFCFGQTRKGQAPQQVDLLDVVAKVFHPSAKPREVTKKKVAFSVVPTTTRSGGRQILVSSINAAFVWGPDPKTNFSTVYFLPYTDFSENKGFGLKYNFFTPHNTWNLTGETRISNLTEYAYGLGSSTTESDQFRLNFNNFRFNVTANKQIYGPFFGGLGFFYDRNFAVGVSEEPRQPGDFEKYGIGTQSASSAIGILFNLLHDNRKNSINPADGLYIQAALRVNPGWLANENLWSSLYLDGRRYFRLDDPTRKIVAVSAFYWGTFGRVPYFNLPSTSLEPAGRSGRGYALSRFRGKHMFYLEGEYRFDITRNGFLGGVGFLNFQSFSDENNRLDGINPAIGGGLRIKFNKRSDTNLVIDAGFAPNSFQLYIALGEWF